jgi:hypothetical protein
MYDGVPAHFSLVDRRYLNRKFPGRLIGTRGPIAWPPRSPDFNPLDFCLWGNLICFAYLSQVEMETLRNRILAGFQTIRNMPGIWDRLRLAMRRRAEACVQAGGGHVEHLLFSNAKS